MKWIPMAILALAGMGNARGEDVATLYRQAIEAYQRGDAAGMLESAQAALAQRPGSAGLTYLAAAARAMGGQSEQALDDLEWLADRGLSQRPDAEPAFAALQGDPRFLGLVDRFERNRQPVGSASRAHTLDDGHFIPEGIAYDAQAEVLYLGSIRQRRIVRIDAEGQASDLLDPGRHGLMSAFGMRLVDGRLYIATSGLKEGGAEAGDRGRAGVLVVDAATGELQAQHWLAGTGHVLGDLVVHGESVIASDSMGGGIWSLNTGDGEWRALVEPGRLVSPQGLVVGPDGTYLYLADYRMGLYRIPVAGGALESLALPPAVTAEGIDGLYRHGRDLIAIQNGIRPHRVIRLRLGEAGDAISEAEVLLSGHADFDEPTLGVVDGDRLLLVANSHWPRFDADGELPDAEQLSGPIVLSLDL